jgi:hypothetical protein
MVYVQHELLMTALADLVYCYCSVIAAISGSTLILLVLMQDCPVGSDWIVVPGCRRLAWNGSPTQNLSSLSGYNMLELGAGRRTTHEGLRSIVCTEGDEVTPRYGPSSLTRPLELGTFLMSISCTVIFF